MNRHVRWIALGVVAVLALALRLQGIEWLRANHDEFTIARWVKWTLDHRFVTERVYPGGFFTLVRPVHRMWITARNLHNRWSLWVGAETQPGLPTQDDLILLGRYFNAVIGTVTCLFIFWLVSRISGSPPAGLLAAALLAFASYHIEHCHYGETDIVMLWTLTVALWLWTVADEYRRPILFLLAALASGYAAGTKFILLNLLPLIFPYAWRAAGCEWRYRARYMMYLIAGFAAFAVGFVWANPATIHIGSFLASAKAAAAKVYLETTGLLGHASGEPFAAYAMRVHSLVLSVQTLGSGWILLVIVGMPFLFSRAYRRHWPVTLLFPILYVNYWIFLAPWVRSQEFLNFMPFLCVVAVLPLAAFWRKPDETPSETVLFPTWFRRSVVLILAVAALAGDARMGVAMSSLFGWPDTRTLAGNWLSLEEPPDRTCGFEAYTEFMLPYTSWTMTSLHKIERYGLEYAEQKNCDYVIRNNSLAGRGTEDPRTGKRFPDYQTRLDTFVAHTELLAVWAPLPEPPITTLCNHEIQLYGLKTFPNAPRLSVTLPQPLSLMSNQKVSCFPKGHALGASSGVVVDRYPKTFGIGGPYALTKPVFLVLNTDEQAARVKIKGFGKRLVISLEPYDTQVILLYRGTSLSFPRKFEKVTVRQGGSARCYARIAFSPAEVARICNELNRPDRALPILHNSGLGRPEERVAAYQIAIETDQWELADMLKKDADKAIACLEKVLKGNDPVMRIGEVSSYYLEEFGRLRLVGKDLPKDTVYPYPFKMPVRVQGSLNERDKLGGRDSALHEAWIPLPVRLARGRYELTGDFSVKSLAEEYPPNALCELLDDEGQVIQTGFFNEWVSAERVKFEATLATYNERQPALYIRFPAPAEVTFNNLVVRWSVRPALESCYNSLVDTQARHLFHRGEIKTAMEILSHATVASK